MVEPGVQPTEPVCSSARKMKRPMDYKVAMDTSLQATNNRTALEKRMREMSADGWYLAHVTSFADPTETVMPTTRIYLFWEREATAEQLKRTVEEHDAGVTLTKIFS